MVIGNAIGLAAAQPQAPARLLDASRTPGSSSSRSRPERRRARRRCCSTCSPTRWRRSARSRSSSCCRAATTPVTTDDLSGLWTVRPWLAVAMTVFMLALMGFPVFGGAGFFAKWYVLQAALQAPAPQIALAVVLVLTTVISAGYYLYVVMVMFMRPRAATARRADARRRRGRSSSWSPARRLILVLGVDAGVFACASPNVGAAAHRSCAGRRRVDATAAASAPADAGRASRRRGAARAAPLLFRPRDRHGHRRRHLPAVRHPRHRRRRSDRRGGARHRPRVRRAACASAACTGAIAVGRDNRPSGDDAARRAGRRAHRVRASTSSTSASCRRRCSTGACINLGVVGGIQITGSHNPAEYNGFKMCLGTESLHGDDIQELYALIDAPAAPTAHGRGARRGRSSTATSTTSSQRIGHALAPDEGRRTTAATAPARSSRRSCSTRSASTRRACSARATAPSRIITPIRPSPRTSRTSSPRCGARAPSSASPSTATPTASAWSTARARSSGATTCSSSTRATCSRARARASRSSST